MHACRSKHKHIRATIHTRAGRRVYIKPASSKRSPMNTCSNIHATLSGDTRDDCNERKGCCNRSPALHLLLGSTYRGICNKLQRKCTYTRIFAWIVHVHTGRHIRILVCMRACCEIVCINLHVSDTHMHDIHIPPHFHIRTLQ